MIDIYFLAVDPYGFTDHLRLYQLFLLQETFVHFLGPFLAEILSSNSSVLYSNEFVALSHFITKAIDSLLIFFFATV